MTRPDPNERAARLTRATSDEPAALTPAVLVVVTLGLGEGGHPSRRGGGRYDVEVGDPSAARISSRATGSHPSPLRPVTRRPALPRAARRCSSLLVAERRAATV